LFIGGIAVFSENTLDHDPKFGSDSLFDGPVDSHISAHHLNELSGNEAERIISQDLDGAIVHLKRIIEGELLFININVDAEFFE
jgi:hypothetical protein